MWLSASIQHHVPACQNASEWLWKKIQVTLWHIYPAVIPWWFSTKYQPCRGPIATWFFNGFEPLQTWISIMDYFIMRAHVNTYAIKENSYKVGVCFFQVGVQIRRQVSWLNYYSARLFCWIAQRKVDTDASVLMSLSLLSIFGTSCCSCIHIICYNMTSTTYDPFCSCIIIETYLADRAAITFVQNKPRLQTKVYLGIFSFAH